jgi:hypothetical protein
MLLPTIQSDSAVKETDRWAVVDGPRAWERYGNDLATSKKTLVEIPTEVVTL